MLRKCPLPASLLAASMLFVPAFARAADPKPATGAAVPPGWAVKADPPKVPATIPEGVTPSLVVPGGEGVLYPNSVSPFVALGNNKEATSSRQVYDLRTSQPVGAALAGKIEITDNVRLSPDGEFLIDVGPTSNKDGIVRVWSMKSGSWVKDLPVTKGPKFLGVLDFAGPGQVAYSDLSDKVVAIWDIASGTKVRELQGLTAQSEDLAFSPNRAYVAGPTNNQHIQIFDLIRGVLAGDLTLPAPADGGISRVVGLKFSPDGTELAALVHEGRKSRLLAWSLADGKPVVDHSFAGDPKHMSPGAFSYKGDLVEWLPDGSAWLLAGHVVVDRNGGRPVWLFRTTPWFKDPGPRKMIDNDRMLITNGPDKAKRLEVVVLPWPKIDAALKLVDDPATKAFVRPGGSVSLKIDVDKVIHGDPEATREELAKILAARLQADGISIAKGMPTVFHARYTEAKGETLHEMKSQPGGYPNPFGGTPTGRTVQATKGACILTWEAAGKKAPLWTSKVDYNPTSMRIQGNELNDAKAREQSFQQMTYTLAGEAIPFFISDDAQTILPGTSELKEGPAKNVATTRATPKATARGKIPAADEKASATKPDEKSAETKATKPKLKRIR